MKRQVLNQTIQMLALFYLTTNVVYACSGPGAGALTAQNRKIVIVYGITALTVILSTIAVYFARGKKGLPAILLSLIFAFFHPVWHYGGGGGDCGGAMSEMAKYVTVILVALLAIQVALWRFRKPYKL